MRDVRPAAQQAAGAGGGTTKAFRSPLPFCPGSIEEVAPTIKRPMVPAGGVLRDRGFMRNALERAKAAGCSTLVFTVDMLTPGAATATPILVLAERPNAAPAATGRPSPIRSGRDVGLNGRPHDLGNISAHLGKPTGLEDYTWLAGE